MPSIRIFLLLLLMSALPASAQVMIGPLPYLSSADSPFVPLPVSGYFYLEDFEDDLFNVPGVTASNGTVVGPEDWGSLLDSVDGDNGPIDGLGNSGRSFFNTSGSVTFTFNAGILGALPTHVGIVWTDGGNPTFQAFGPGNVLLGTLSGTHADGSNYGGTAEDRFYGINNPGGIESIKITAASWELDHLQYGTLAAVPEPATWQLFLSGSAMLGLVWWRRQSRDC